MSAKSPLTEALQKWTEEGGDLDDILSSESDHPVETPAEANAICAALDALRTKPELLDEEAVSSPLHTLTAFFQQAEGDEAIELLRQNGLPRLRAWVRDALEEKEMDDDDVMFILKILAMYGQPEDVELIAEAARKPINADGFMWSVILGQFSSEHPGSADMIEALRSPLPSDFLRVAYLDMVNGLAIAEELEQHPFDADEGLKQLATWLRDMDEDNFSYAHSATAALPFISSAAQEELLQIAASHPDPGVRMEAAWAQAKIGDSAGLQRLVELCLDPNHSYTAQHYLEELQHADMIPDAAREPDFRAIAEMSNWLAHPNEYGSPPDSIELYDTRELYWPPSDDTRRLSLVKYTYDNEGDDDESESGVGMVGSITFALFGETTADLSPEDIYALHCCWELEMHEDERAPEERTAEIGRQILAEHNPGF